MKKTLLSMLLGVCIAGSAAAESYDFSYVGSPTTSLGIQSAETYDVAICLPGDLFEGFRIKEIRANVNASTGVSNYSDPCLWLSADLSLVNNAFTPGIATYETQISSDGLLTTTLPEEYVIPAEGVNVGYSVTVKKLTNGSKYPMSCAECSNPNSFLCRTNKSMPQWSNIATDMGLGACITVVLESDEVAAHSVSFVSAPASIYMEIDQPWNGSFTFSSFAKEPVNSIDVEYSIEGADYSQHLDLDTEVPAGLNKQFTVDMQIAAFDHKLSQTVDFKVVKVNGEPNESNNSVVSVPLAVLNEIPTRQTLIEEYTGTWCGWCSRGYAALEYIKENEPDFVVAAFHNSDPMAITTDYPVSPSGFPFATLNRAYGADPYYGTQTYGGILPIVEDVKALNAEVTPWGIEVSHEWDGDNTLIAKADVWNVAGYESGHYEIAYLLVADGLSGKSSSWFQNNNYASESPSDEYIPQLNAFCRGGDYGKSKVGGLTFNDVVVSTDGIYGVAGSIPSALEAETKVSHSISFDLSQISSTLIPDRNKLRVIAAVLDGRGTVMNCAKNEVNDYEGASVEVNVDEDAPVEFYNLNGVKVINPEGGIFIRKQGDKTSKVVIK